MAGDRRGTEMANEPASDGYYDEDMGSDDELDLSFLDEQRDDPDESD